VCTFPDLFIEKLTMVLQAYMNIIEVLSLNSGMMISGNCVVESVQNYRRIGNMLTKLKCGDS
jgi:ABC-type dipeptide/oligopeptide/nickel transport system permease component